MCSCDIFLGLLALLFPPLPVWVKRGICSADSVINILLCMLGYLPGLIHAWYIIIKFPEPDFDYAVLPQDAEGGGRVTYVVVQQPGAAARPHVNGGGAHITEAAPKIQGHLDYGTTNNDGAAAVAGAASSSAAAPAPAATASSSSAAGPSSSAAPNAGEGSSNGPPPSYAQAVAGDNKIQTQD